MLQIYQNKPKTRAIKNKKTAYLFYILVIFFILITTCFFAIKINLSKQLTDKNRIKNQLWSKSGQDKQFGGNTDVLCYSQLKRFFNPLNTQVGDEFWLVFSNQSINFATYFKQAKRLIYIFFLSINRVSVLSKYRFLRLRVFLEENQAEVFLITKISQNKDTLSLVKGLVFGEKDQLNSYYATFQQAGMVHILVASGFNVALLVGVVKPLLFFTSRITKNYLTMVVFWLYIWFIGGEPPLLRAGLMVSFYLLVLNFGLKISSRRIVFYSGAILLLLKPALLKSLSFWFSFLATLGLLLFNRSFLLLFNSSKLGITEFFSKEFYSTFSAQLLILPLVIYFFGEFNWLSFVTNTFFLFPVAWFTQVGFSYFLLLFLTKGTVFSGLLWPYSLVYREIILLFIEMVSQVKAGYYLLFSLKPEEKTFYLLVWSLSFCLITSFLRIKTNKKVVFLHETV